MLIVSGSVRIRGDAIDEALDLGLEHVRRSRSEPGCLLHSVHRDAEDPSRLVFIEHWSDHDALGTHFAVPASLDFVRRLGALAAERAHMEIFEATPTTV